MSVGTMTNRSRNPGKITIRDVARAAGVSAATVSRALNTPGMLAPKTLQRVREAIDHSRFMPNMLAGSLAMRRTHSIALFIPSVKLSLFEPTLRTIIEEFSAQNQQVLIGFGGTTDAEFNEQLGRALMRRPDAGIVIGIQLNAGTRQRIAELEIPFLQSWEAPADPLDMAVGYDYDEVGKALAGLVVRRNYRRPALVWGTGHIPGLTRESIVRRLLAAGLPEPACVTVKFPGDFRDGAAAFPALWEGRPDCVLCISDLVAHGLIAQAGRAGLSVPGDLAVVGFGDMSFAEGMHPPLTTIRIDAEEIGRHSAAMILQRLAGEAVPERSLNLGFELVERVSG